MYKINKGLIYAKAENIYIYIYIYNMNYNSSMEVERHIVKKKKYILLRKSLHVYICVYLIAYGQPL